MAYGTILKLTCIILVIMFFQDQVETSPQPYGELGSLTSNPLDPFGRMGRSIRGRCRPSEGDADCEGDHPCCSCFGFCGFDDGHCTTYSWQKLGSGSCPARPGGKK